VVEEASTSYVCATAHTSGTFATDRTSGYWVVLGTYISGGASSVSFSATGTIAATNVQAAIAEVAAESLQVGNNLSDVASASSARSNLSVPSRADIQLMTYNHAAAAGTVDAITASYTPTVSSLTDRLRLSFVASGANTSTTPTFTPNSGTVTAKTVVKGSNTALAVGDIPGGNSVAVVEYNSTLDKWVLLNPASSVNAMPTTGGTFTGDVTLGTGAQIFLDDSVTAAGTALPLTFDGDGNTGWYRPSADNIMLVTSGTDRMLWDDNGNVTFKTAGGKIKADFSNSSHNSRTIFETTSTNSATYIGAQASGSGTIAGFVAYQGSGADLAAGNYSFGAFTHITGTETRIESGKAGTGTYYPITLYAAGAEQVRVLATASATRYITLSGSNGGNPTISTSAGSLAITPAVVMASTLAVTSDFAVNTDKFTVAAATGNTVVAGTLGVTGVATFTAQPILSSLTASQAVFTDGSKGLVSNAITGTGNVVMSASPTLTGTITAAAISMSGDLTVATNKFTVAAASGNTVVAGTLAVAGTTSSSGRLIFTGNDLGNASEYYVCSYAAGNLMAYNVPTGKAHSFLINNGTGMTLDSSGNLLVGTTTAPTYGKVHVSAGIQVSQAGAGGFFTSRDGTNENAYLSLGANYNIGNAYDIALAIANIAAAASKQITIQNRTNGVYLADGATAWAAVSDEREKDIVESITDAVDKVATLRAVIGKYKIDAEGTRRSFLIAQDVRAVLPEAVDATNPERLALAYSDTIPLLVAAINELSARVSALES